MPFADIYIMGETVLTYCLDSEKTIARIQLETIIKVKISSHYSSNVQRKKDQIA